MGKFVKDHNAGGFIEDLPVILLVIVGTGLFLTSAVQAYAAYDSSQRALRMDNQAQDLLDSFLSWDRIMGPDGSISMERLEALDDSTLIEFLGDDISDKGVQIMILEANSFGDRTVISIDTEEPPLEGDVFVRWGAAPAKDASGRTIALQVGVMVWEH